MSISETPFILRSVIELLGKAFPQIVAAAPREYEFIKTRQRDTRTFPLPRVAAIPFPEAVVSSEAFFSKFHQSDGFTFDGVYLDEAGKIDEQAIERIKRLTQ